MLVSILVPIYNVENYLTKCLDSIFSQTYPTIEYIFVNDCCTDNSLIILNEYINNVCNRRNNIHIISHDVNLGIAVTRNDCISAAKGDYILFVDSDDWIEPNMVEELIKGSQDGKNDIVACDFYTDYTNGKQTLGFENYAESCEENLTKLLNYDIATTLWKLLVRRSLYEHFQFSPKIEIGEDYTASIKLFYYAKTFNVVHKYLYHYTNFNTERYSKQKLKSLEHHTMAIKEVEEFLNKKQALTQERQFKLNLRKFNVKSNYLYSPCKNYKKWEITFPEATYMWRYTHYSLKEKIRFWLAEHHIYF